MLMLSGLKLIYPKDKSKRYNKIYKPALTYLFTFGV